MSKGSSKKRRGAGSGMLLGIGLGLLFGMANDQMAMYMISGAVLGAIVDWNRARIR